MQKIKADQNRERKNMTFVYYKIHETFSTCTCDLRLSRATALFLQGVIVKF